MTDNRKIFKKRVVEEIKKSELICAVMMSLYFLVHFSESIGRANISYASQAHLRALAQNLLFFLH